MRAEIEREAVKFAGEPFKLGLETGGRLRPSRQDNQSLPRETNFIIRLEVSGAARASRRIWAWNVLSAWTRGHLFQ